MRTSLLVHALVALVNGLISLTILLIAPLGLLAVITLTVFLMLVTFLGGVTGERVIRWLAASQASRRSSTLRPGGGLRSLPSSRRG